MKKTWFCVFVSLWMLLTLLCLPATAAEPEVVFGISDATAKPGDTVTLTLSYTATADYDTLFIPLLDAQGNAYYDSGTLVFGGFSNYGTIAGLSFSKDESFDAAKQAILLYFTGTKPTPDESGAVFVCDLTFQIPADAVPGAYTVGTAGMEVSATNGSGSSQKDLTTAVNVGTVKVTHDTTRYAAVQATCSKSGNLEYYHCNTCNKDYFDEFCQVPATGQYKETTASHTSDGVLYSDSKHHWNKCTVCGTQVNKFAHTAKNSTPSKDADAHWQVCECGVAINKTAHYGGTATCTSTATCSFCKMTYGAADPNNHTGKTEIRNVSAATCSQAGYTGDTYCLGCNQKTAGGEVIPATGAHTPNGIWLSDGTTHWQVCGCGTADDQHLLETACSGGQATCAAKAVCKVCGKGYGDSNTSNHVGPLAETGAKVPTCSTNGRSPKTVCSACNMTLTEGTEIAATGAHVDADGKWETNSISHWHTCGCGTKFDLTEHTGGTATCTSKAVCSVCKIAYGSEDAGNHSGKALPDDTPATHTTSGTSGKTKCSACNKAITKGTYVAADESAHVITEWISDANSHWHVCGDPDCSMVLDKDVHSDGIATCKSPAKCVICGTAYDTGEEEVTHTGPFEVIGAFEATHEKIGYKGDTYCTGCGIKTKTGETIPNLNENKHTDADGKWESDGTSHWHTCTCDLTFDKTSHKGGTATCHTLAVCEDCGAEYGSFAPKNHAGATEVREAIAATCSTNGQTGDRYCLGCGQKVRDGTVIKKTNAHVDADGKWTSDADGHWHTCGCGINYNRTDHTYTEKYDADNHWKECTVCGYKQNVTHHVYPTDSDSQHYYKDSDAHYPVCDCGHRKPDAEAHVYTTGSACDKCGFVSLTPVDIEIAANELTAAENNSSYYVKAEEITKILDLKQQADSSAEVDTDTKAKVDSLLEQVGTISVDTTTNTSSATGSTVGIDGTGDASATSALLKNITAEDAATLSQATKKAAAEKKTATLDIVVYVEDSQDTSEGKDIADEYATDNNMKVLTQLDITVEKVVKIAKQTVYSEQVTELAEPTILTIDIPKDATNKNLVVLQTHTAADGTCTTTVLYDLPDGHPKKDNNPLTIQIEVNKFSVYSVAEESREPQFKADAGTNGKGGVNVTITTANLSATRTIVTALYSEQGQMYDVKVQSPASTLTVTFDEYRENSYIKVFPLTEAWLPSGEAECVTIPAKDIQ